MMKECEKKELLDFLNSILVELENVNNKEKSKRKPFSKFCRYDEEEGYAYFYKGKFEKTFNTSGYKLEGTNVVCDDDVELKVKKVDKKDIEKVLDSVIKDDEIGKNIGIVLGRLKDFKGRPYKVPVNGKTFLELFEKLYADMVNVQKSKNISIFEKALETKKIKSILNFLIEETIINKYLKFYSKIKKIELSIMLFNGLLGIIKEDKYVTLSSENQEFIRKFLVFSKDEDEKFDKIINYNNELFARKLNNECEDITSLQFMQNIDRQISNLKEKQDSCIEYFRHTNSFFDGNDIDSLIMRLRMVKKENYENDIKYIIEKLLYQNPEYQPFINLISPTFGAITPITKRVIGKPHSFDDILEILDCYDEILSAKSHLKVNFNNKVSDIIKEIAKEIKETYKNAVEVSRKVNVALPELEGVKTSIKNGKKITIKDKEAYVESSFGIINSDADKMKMIASSQIKAFEKYNNRLSEIIAKRKQARRIKTDIIKKLESNGIEISSVSLRTEIEKQKDDKEFLLILESVLDKAYEQCNEESYYHDLCGISFDCTKYIKDCSGMSFSDGEDLREEIKRFNCI